MRLFQLLTCLEYALIQADVPVKELEISGISYDSRSVKKGELFVCLRGYKSDGHAYITQAAENGAAAVLTDRLASEGELLRFPKNLAVLLVQDTRESLAYLSAAWFGYPAEKLKLIGITGTKGKTTVACLIKAMLEAEGKTCGYIGTIGVQIREKMIQVKNTTPESFTIHEYFDKMVKAGCKYAVVEVSSQGLKYKRVDGIRFEAGVFTNLGEDHIGPGEHENFNDYRHSKSLLFEQCRIGIGNVDDPQYAYMFRRAGCRKYGFSMDPEKASRIAGTEGCPEAERILCARDIRFSIENGAPVTVFEAGGISCRCSLPGRFNVSNALAALQTLRCLNEGDTLWQKRAAETLSTAAVTGRMERVYVDGKIACYVDYAHNAMSLENALVTLRDYRPGRLITVFGCGGNRAKSRRTQMGEVAGRLSDYTIITSDNPRFERPEDIMRDIETGIRETGGAYTMTEDRGDAIAQALCMAEEGDIILVAGKGHEDYQEVEGVRHPMDDRRLIREAWERRMGQEYQNS